MDIQRFGRFAAKFAADNSPTILTAVGVIGTVSTAYLTGKATFKAADIIRIETFKRADLTDPSRVLTPEELDKTVPVKEKFKMVWTLYIPAATSLTFTVTAIVLANKIGLRRAAALAAAYSMSEKRLDEYKDKVAEKFGVKKRDEVNDAVAQDRVDRTPASGSQIVISGNGDVLCFDEWTGRYFESDMESIKKAQNNLNYKALNNGYASLNDFYTELGLERIKNGDDFGWNSDKLLEIYFATTMSDQNRPCISMQFHVEPVRDFYRTH